MYSQIAPNQQRWCRFIFFSLFSVISVNCFAGEEQLAQRTHMLLAGTAWQRLALLTKTVSCSSLLRSAGTHPVLCCFFLVNCSYDPSPIPTTLRITNNSFISASSLHPLSLGSCLSLPPSSDSRSLALSMCLHLYFFCTATLGAVFLLCFDDVPIHVWVWVDSVSRSVFLPQLRALGYRKWSKLL